MAVLADSEMLQSNVHKDLLNVGHVGGTYGAEESLCFLAEVGMA